MCSYKPHILSVTHLTLSKHWPYHFSFTTRFLMQGCCCSGAFLQAVHCQYQMYFSIIFVACVVV